MNSLLKKSLVISVLAGILICGSGVAVAQTTATPYEFARVFIDQLVETHKIEELANLEMVAAQKTPNAGQQQLLSAVRNCTRMKLMLNVMVGRTEQMHLADTNFEKIPDYLIQMYTRKSELCDEIVQASKIMLEGERKSVNYGKIAGRMPEITAQFEFINETIFKATPMIALSLISTKPDSNNKLSHLSITRKQSKELVVRLQSGFGKSLDAKNSNWTTSAASVMRAVLRDKGYKYSDDPWN